jgi:hypothetical protein
MKMTFFTIKAGSPLPFWLGHLYHLRWFTFTIKMVHQSRSGALNLSSLILSAG